MDEKMFYTLPLWGGVRKGSHQQYAQRHLADIHPTVFTAQQFRRVSFVTKADVSLSTDDRIHEHLSFGDMREPHLSPQYNGVNGVPTYTIVREI